MVLGDSSADDDRAGGVGIVGQLGEHLLVREEVDPELPVHLVVHPQLASEGSVGDPGDHDGDVVLVALVEQGVLVVQAGADLVDDLVSGHLLGLGEDLVEHGQEVVLQDDPVAGVGDEDVPEPADLVLVPQLGVVHVEVALVVGGEGPGEVVVQGSAGRYDEVDHVVLDHVDYDSAGSGRHYAGGEREDLEAPLLLDHGLGDVGGIGELLGGESAGASHSAKHLVDGHAFGNFDVLNRNKLEFVSHWLTVLHYRRVVYYDAHLGMRSASC